jgi:hypothetical protein
MQFCDFFGSETKTAGYTVVPPCGNVTEHPTRNGKIEGSNPATRTLCVRERETETERERKRKTKTRVKPLSGAPLWGRLLALLTNVRLGWKGLPGTNTLVYYEH